VDDPLTKRVAEWVATLADDPRVRAYKILGESPTSENLERVLRRYPGTR
jgi:hypothetical protein